MIILQYQYLACYFWNTLMLITFQQHCGILYFGLFVFYSSALYLKLKFNEIDNKIHYAINISNYRLLNRYILEHNYMSKLTHDMNIFFSNIIFIVYYITTPGYLFLLYSIHNKQTAYSVKYFSGIFCFLVFNVLISFIVLSTWISNSAHKSRKFITGYLSTVSLNKVHFKNRLKIKSFIEYLSGREIGFYCFKLISNELFCINLNIYLSVL